MPYADLEKKRKTHRRWQEANRQKLRDYQREYKRKRRENPDLWAREKEARKEYYARTREESQRKSREYMRTYYLANKPLFQVRSRKQYEAKRAWFKEYVATLSCSHCPESHPDVLEFHHPDPKGKIDGRRVEPPISALLTYSKERILAAAKECIVLCANCHRKEHARLRRMQV